MHKEYVRRFNVQPGRNVINSDIDLIPLDKSYENDN